MTNGLITFSFAAAAGGPRFGTVFVFPPVLQA